MRDKLKIYTFHPFEKSIIKDIFFKNNIDLEVEIFPFKDFKFNSNIKADNHTIFIGTCAGNEKKSSLGDLYQVDAIHFNNTKYLLEPNLNLAKKSGKTFYTTKPIPVSFDLGKCSIAEMESYQLFHIFGDKLNMVRVVTDFGFDSSISIAEYKKSIEGHYREGITKFVKKIKKIKKNIR